MSKITVTTIAGLTSGGDANTVKIESGDDFTVDTNTLHVDSSSDKVGIGTTSPSYPLTVSHASTAYHHSTNGTAQSIFGVDAANTNILGSISNHDLRFITNTTEQGRITTAGVHTKPNQPAFHIQGTAVAHSAGTADVAAAAAVRAERGAAGCRPLGMRWPQHSRALDQTRLQRETPLPRRRRCSASPGWHPTLW